MKLALLQLNFRVGDLQGNAEKILKAVRDHQQEGIDLFLTSELSLTGYPPKDLLMNRSFVERAAKSLEALAEELKEHPPILVGAPERHRLGRGTGLFNSSFLLHEGKVKETFRKSLLPNYDVFDERRYFDGAESCKPFLFQGQRIAVTICEDLWNDVVSGDPRYDQNPVELLRQEGFDLLLNLSSSPFSLGKEAHRRQMIGEIARRSKTPLVYVNQVGGNDDLIFDGRSGVYDEGGRLIRQAASFAEDVLLYELGEAGEKEPEPMQEGEELFHALVLGTRDYVTKTGFSKAVLGLSGGIDSALTAVIACEALGPQMVTGVLMPSPYSSQHSLDDSYELARNLGMPTHEIPIAPMMKAFEESLIPAIGSIEKSLTEENLQARIRGNLLMSFSNHLGAILLTTGNKSELSVGYCTIYGDMAGGLAVISDLPKTKVYELCRWINRNKGGRIPGNILTKPPSAELRPDQTDQDSLPEYDVLDAILRLHIEEHQSADEIIAQGFDRKEVMQAVRLVAISEFKRKQAAPGLKVTDQAFGTGWRMPIVAKRF